MAPTGVDVHLWRGRIGAFECRKVYRRKARYYSPTELLTTVGCASALVYTAVILPFVAMACTLSSTLLLTFAVCILWGCEVICIRSSPSSPAESRPSDQSTNWDVDISALSPSTVAGNAVLSALVTALALLILLAGDVERNPGPHTIPLSSLRDLVNLPIPVNWKDLGLQLGIAPDQLDTFQLQHKNDPNHVHRCLYSMFDFWLTNSDDPTYETLVEALVAIGRHNVAQQICKEHGLPLPAPTSVPTPSCILAYRDYLLERYQQMSTTPDSTDDWPPSVAYTDPCLILGPHDESFKKDANEELIEAVTTVRRKVEEVLLPERSTQDPEEKEDNPVQSTRQTSLCDILKPKLRATGIQYPLKVMIYGPPGIGKTTLARKIVKDWANGDLLCEFTLVLLVHLRERKLHTLADLFYHDNSCLQDDVLDMVTKSSGKDIIVIFDGLDELKMEERKHSLVGKIIRGEALHRASVIVTCRPHVIEYFKCMKRYVEILEFSNDRMQECIENTVDKTIAKQFLQELALKPDMESLCHNPLFCSILVYMYKRDQFVLPKTLTGLYRVFVLHALVRYMRITGVPEYVRAKCQGASEPLDNLPLELQKIFDILCQIAFEGQQQHKTVFSYLEIVNPLSSILEHNTLSSFSKCLLGLMEGVQSFGELPDFQFLHSTIQEFLAARWIAKKLEKEEQAKLVSELLCSGDSGDADSMLLFFAGYSKLQGMLSCSGALTTAFSETMKRLSKSDVCDQPYLRFIFLCNILYESQNSVLCTIVSDSLVKRKVKIFEFASHNASQFAALSYFLASSTKAWDKVWLGYIGTTIIKAVSKFDHTFWSNGIMCGKVQFTSSLTSIPHILRFPLFKAIDNLTVDLAKAETVISLGADDQPIDIGKCIDALGVQSLTIKGHWRWLPFEYETELDLEFGEPSYSKCMNPLNPESLRLVKAFRNSKSLRKICFPGCWFHLSMAAVLLSNVVENEHIESIDLSDNMLFEPCEECIHTVDVGPLMDSLVKILCSGLRCIKLTRCGITDEIMEQLVLEVNDKLACLSVSETKKLPRLSIDGNTCSSHGLTTLLTILHSCRGITIGDHRKTIPMCVEERLQNELVTILRANYIEKMTVKFMDLTNTDELKTIAYEGLRCNTSLTTLKLKKVHILSSGLANLFRALRYHRTIRKLHISGIPKQKYDQERNRQVWLVPDEDGSRALAEMIWGNSSLTELVIKLSKFTLSEMKVIAGGLLQNSTLEKIELESCGRILRKKEIAEILPNPPLPSNWHCHDHVVEDYSTRTAAENCCCRS